MDDVINSATSQREDSVAIFVSRNSQPLIGSPTDCA
jgi:hypothetical protein